MSTDEIKKLAAAKTPDVKIKIEKDFYRHNVIDSLAGADNVGIELGVAGGDFLETNARQWKIQDILRRRSICRSSQHR